MALSPKITAAVASLMADAGIGSILNSGKLRIYDGSQPANCGDAITTQNLLVELTLASDAFPGASSGVLTANAIGPQLAIYAGEATWFRILKSDNTAVLDGSVGLADCDLNLDDTTIEVGDVVAIVSAIITMPRE